MKIIEITQDENGVYCKMQIEQEDDTAIKSIKKGIKKRNKKMKLWNLKK